MYRGMQKLLLTFIGRQLSTCCWSKATQHSDREKKKKKKKALVEEEPEDV